MDSANWSMTALEVLQLDGAGAEIVGADVTLLTVGDWNQIEAAFASFGLLVFRDQILTEEDHIDFARRWGSLERSSSGSFPEIAVAGPKNATDTQYGVWHTNGSFTAKPPCASVAIARSIPASGSTIMFANTYAAFDALTGGTQRALEALRAMHSSAATGGGEAPEVVAHPLVIHHPVSGRKTLYLNPTFTTSVEDMEEREGLGLLNQLYDHCQQPEFTTTVEWEPGTVVIWDERAIWHFWPTAAKQSTVHTVTVSGSALKPGVAPAKKDPTLTERAGATLAGGLLTAAMTGIAEVIDPERVTQDIEIVSEAPEQDDLPDFDFGGLPPID